MKNPNVCIIKWKTLYDGMRKCAVSIGPNAPGIFAEIAGNRDTLVLFASHRVETIANGAEIK